MLWAVIMAGGSGTRFWPASRAKKPKQFLNLFGPLTLLEQTAFRVRSVIPPARTLVMTRKSFVPFVRKTLKLSGAQVIGESAGRNTAPCAVLAAALAVKKDADAVVALLPADQRIQKVALFQKALRAASEVAARSALPVTFGIRPSFAHTGFGYLERGTVFEKKGEFQFFRLRRFCEKPSLKKAQAFLKAKRYWWNSGMFVWRADALLAAARKYQPRIFLLAEKIAAGSEGGLIQRMMQKHFSAMPAVSIDYGLMEPLKEGILTVPLEIGWNDLGGWQVLPEILQSDKNGNVILGKALSVESSGNIVKSGQRLVALLGVKDFVVADTEDVLLICPRSRSEEIRKIVRRLKKENLTKYL